MKNFLILTISLLVGVLVFSCAERAICPAYQSAFIHDKTALDKHFSYFGEDSLPKQLLTASKNKFLIIEKDTYKKKSRSFNTVPMQTIYPVLDDSTQLAGDVQMLAEMDVVDSVALDSAIQNELPWKEKFNVEQEFYFNYFNEILVYPEERLEAELEKKEKGVEGGAQEQGFFKRTFGSLFKKKKDDAQNSIEEGEGEKKKRFFKNLFGGKKNKNNNIPDLEEEIDATVVEEQSPAQNKPPEDDSDTDDGEDDF